MKLFGIQKLTLLDFPGKVACTVFTGGCNFRCPFCHNASLVTHIEEPVMEEDEFFAFLKKRQGVLEGVAVTGGEPTLVPDLIPFLKRIRELGYGVKLDTNGSHPYVLKEILDGNLADYVAMDIKNSLEKYGATIGIPSYDTSKVEMSAALLMNGSTPFEFRTTVVSGLHEAEDFRSIGKWLKGDEKYFLQYFKDSGDLICDGMSGFPQSTMEEFCGILSGYIPAASLRG